MNSRLRPFETMLGILATVGVLGSLQMIASLSRKTLRRHIAITLAPALAMLGLMVAPATHAAAAQTFLCSYSSAPMDATVPLSDGTQLHMSGGEHAGYYAGIIVQPSSTGVSEAGKE